MEQPGFGFSVIVADDNDLHRAGVTAVLEHAGDMTVLGSVATSESLFKLLEHGSPDVVLIEARLGDLTAAQLCRSLKHSHPHTAVVVLTTLTDETLIHSCLAAGVRGYLLKEGRGSDVVEAVRRVARGEPALASIVVERVITWARMVNTVHADSQMLAPAEVLALSLTAQGMSTKEIAQRMRIGTTTAKQHLRAAMRKLGATQRAEAVAAGIRRGVI